MGKYWQYQVHRDGWISSHGEFISELELRRMTVKQVALKCPELIIEWFNRV